MLEEIKGLMNNHEIYSVKNRLYYIWWDTDKGHTLILIECDDDYEIRLLNRVMQRADMDNLIYKMITEREELK